MRIILTGSTGSIGSSLRAALESDGDTVLGLSRTSQIACDITIKEDVDHFVKKGMPDIVIHLAANSDVSVAENDPNKDLATNVSGTLNLLRAIMNLDKIPHLVFASSVQVYGGRNPITLTERTTPSPTNPYGIGKLTAEMYIEWYGRKGLPFTIARINNVYGPGLHKGVIPTVINQVREAKEKDKISMRGNSKDTRDFLYIDDLVDFFRKTISEGPKNTVIIVGSGISTPVASLPALIGSVLGKRVEAVYDSETFLSSIYNCDISQAKALYNWKPKTILSDGLINTLHMPTKT